MSAHPLSDRGKIMKMMIYSDPGAGKTQLIGGSPGRVLIIRPYIDHTESILDADRPRMAQFDVHNWAEMDEAKDYCRMEGRQFNFVWLDSISGWQDVGLDDVWENVALKNSNNPKRKDYGPDQGEYGNNMDRLGRWVRDMVGIADSGAFHFGLTAWHADIAPPKQGAQFTARKIMPWVQGKNMSAKICGYMNVVARLEVIQDSKGNVRRVFRLADNQEYHAKNQFDPENTQPSLWDPSIEKFMNTFNVEYTGQSPRRRGRAGRR